ncbi:hypothetical protein AcW1_004330 [Taiwanofungus camphoratus]|nr:hypothetical protein AcW2_006662 [Antrodia cinnamomea]KAI0952164.1 hypothetical protein AcV7_008049 [Antrodia cinnamomea]KAI0959534.1 hypothetical protein AcW1_004330 [Antrodia cinnamomea]
MPVPVPVYTKQPAHPVIKINQSVDTDYKSSVFQHLTHSLPLPPRGPPPSLGTREEWISSLPSWRRNKPRRIWEEDACQYHDSCSQGFEEGLTVADNAAVIKGAPAQACIPPVSTLLASAGFISSPPTTGMYASSQGDADDEMSAYSAPVHGWQCADEAPLSAVSPITNADYDEMEVDKVLNAHVGFTDYEAETPGSYRQVNSVGLYPETYERGAFTPVFEDMSPEPIIGHEPASSPLGPSTPFADFVDRAVAAAQAMVPYDHYRPINLNREIQYDYRDECCDTQCVQCQTYHREQLVQAPAPEPVVTPTATAAYKKLAEPISEWIASFVWKVCTTGMSLPSTYYQPFAFVKHYSSIPPPHLASSTHSMLLSTLLQPSAIFLALRYIVRLPVFFGPVNLDRDKHWKEIRFRDELLGEAHIGIDRDVFETHAPFRLILLGCMLANKWLDDHTFSNKTWHTISNIPIQSLNKLESLALDVFRYDLSISTHEWSDWLSHLLSYHSSLSSSSCPQPISRPSASPHTLVRKAIEKLYEVRVIAPAYHCRDDEKHPSGPPEPIFVSIEEPRIEKRAAQQTFEEGVDVLEIDLDEDGPLREEYLPKRRVGGIGSGSIRRSQGHEMTLGGDRNLPPPAKWSPSADEPIIRERDSTRAQVHYVAPQPIAHLQALPPPLPFHQVVDSHRQVWSLGGYFPAKEELRPQEYTVTPVYPVQPSYIGYGYGHPASQTHSRSQSLSYHQAVAGQPQGRLRSYSQTGFDHGYSDVRFTENRFVLPPPVISGWATADRSTYTTFYDYLVNSHQGSLKV